jgi:hypothetical protein
MEGAKPPALRASPGIHKKEEGLADVRLTDARRPMTIGVQYSRDAMAAKEEGPPTVAGFSFFCSASLCQETEARRADRSEINSIDRLVQ